jgi:hypothetical protein
MIHIFVVAVILVGIAMQAFAAQSPLSLVRDGKAASVIVTADKPAAAGDAARDLQMWLEKAGGAKITIQTEGSLPREGKATRILVGDSKAARSLGPGTREYRHLT